MNKMPSMLLNHKEIVGDDKVRENKCLQEILRSINRYDCILVPKITLIGATIDAKVEVKAMNRDGANARNN